MNIFRLGIQAAIVVAVIGGLISQMQQRNAIQQGNQAASGGSASTSGPHIGRTNVFDLRTGDCISSGGAAQNYETVTAVACDSPTAVYRVELMVLVPGSSTYPGDAYMEEQSDRCPVSTTFY